MKLLLPYETYIKQRLAFHLLFSSDADRRRSTLNLSSHQMALELSLKQREQHSVWPHHYSSVRLDPFAPVNISVEGGALKALKSSSVVVLVKAVCSLCVQFEWWEKNYFFSVLYVLYIVLCMDSCHRLSFHHLHSWYSIISVSFILLTTS